MKQLTSSAFLVVFGAAVFYVGLTWFRSHTTVSTELMENGQVLVDAIAPTSVSAAEEVFPTRANLVSAFDGQVTGVVNRMSTETSINYHVLVYLPGIDRSAETYSLWLLKDGISDVKRMGDLSPRADGSWVLDFTAGPVSGISTPDLYRTLVIMKQPAEDGGTSNGTKMAEAVF